MPCSDHKAQVQSRTSVLMRRRQHQRKSRHTWPSSSQFYSRALAVIPDITDITRWDEKAGLRAGCGVRSQVIDVLEAQIKRRPAMKKVSTRAAAQSRNILRQKLSIGLDLAGAGANGAGQYGSRLGQELR